MNNEQVLQNLKVMLAIQANKDLGYARKNGAMAITQTKSGNLEIRYNDGQYMILDFNNTNFAHYVGRKAGAVEFLVNNYEVICD